MIEVHENLYVGAEIDEKSIRGRAGWFIIHACKEPYHRHALGYTGKGASKDHPEYLIAHREGRLILNLVDVEDVRFISPIIIDAALDAVHSNIVERKVLIHCNQGQSRSPAIALLYLVRHTRRLDGLSVDQALARFTEIYPPFNPARGMMNYIRMNWQRYGEPGRTTL